STDRLQAIQQLVAEHTGEALPDFADTVLRAIPVQAGGLFPITDVWYIERAPHARRRLITPACKQAKSFEFSASPPLGNVPTGWHCATHPRQARGEQPKKGVYQDGFGI